MHGICHVEIPANDLERAGKFYSSVFGWEITSMPEMEYLLYKTPEGVGGGFSKEAQISEKPGVFLYIEVEDIPEALKKIAENGGTETQPKTQISPEHGYFATFSDPEGNTIGLWSKS